MFMYTRIDTSIDPKIIGTTKETKQVRINKRFHKDLDRLYNMGCENFSEIKGELFENALLTDIMRFSPYTKGLCFIISDFFLDSLINYGIKKNDFFLRRIVIKNELQPYYFLVLPAINLEDIVFKKSIIFLPDFLTGKPIEYFKINSLEEYLIILKKFTYLSFEKIVLPQKYSENDIIYLPKVWNSVFFKDELYNFLEKHLVTNLVIKDRLCNIQFSN